MESLWTLIAGGFGTLFVVAVAVAWWEHLERTDRRPPPFETPRPGVAVVDIDLGESAAPGGDGGERQTVLAGALGRMSLPLDAPATGDRSKPAGWMDTRPMITNPADLVRGAGTATGTDTQAVANDAPTAVVAAPLQSAAYPVA